MQGIKTKVLIADDEEVIANTLAIILGRAGFDARAVYSGEMVVELAQSFQPDLLLSDVMMAGITGIQAAIQVRQKFPGCEVLLFSGQAATVDLLEEAHAQGCKFEILAKPVHPADLLARLRHEGPPEHDLDGSANGILDGGPGYGVTSEISAAATSIGQVQKIA